MSRHIQSTALAALLLTLLHGGVAKANPFEQIGFGTRGQGMSNAMVASSDVLGSPMYNPAGGVLGDGDYELGVGYSYSIMKLELNDQDPNTLEPRGFWFAGVIPFKAGPVDLAVGLNVYMPDQFILRAHSVPATEPRLVMWDNRPHRAMLQSVLSARLTEWLSLGAGISLMGGVKGREVEFVLDADPAATRAEATIIVDFPILISPVVGIMLQPIPELRIGARFREDEGINVVVNLIADVTVPGTQVDGDVLLSFIGPSGYSPREVAFGGSYDIGGLTVSAELGWLQWSLVNQVAASVDVAVNLGVDVPTSVFVEPPPRFSDIWVPRVGLEYGFDVATDQLLMVRTGYSFMPSPVPAQTGETNFGDADRHIMSLGGSYEFPVLGERAAVEAAFQVQHMPRREMVKENPSAPGGDLSVGGQIYTLSLGVRVSL